MKKLIMIFIMIFILNIAAFGKTFCVKVGWGFSREASINDVLKEHSDYIFIQAIYDVENDSVYLFFKD